MLSCYHKEKINGDVNVSLVHTAVQTDKPKKFVYISSANFNFPEFVLRGYFNGKRRTENAIAASFGIEGGIILKPGMVYGTRQINENFSIPLSFVGKPLEGLLTTAAFRYISNEQRKGSNFFQSSFVGRVLAIPPVDVNVVGKSAALGALVGPLRDEDVHDCSDILSGKVTLWDYDKMINVADIM